MQTIKLDIVGNVGFYDQSNHELIFLSEERDDLKKTDVALKNADLLHFNYGSNGPSTLNLYINEVYQPKVAKKYYVLKKGYLNLPSGVLQVSSPLSSDFSSPEERDTGISKNTNTAVIKIEPGLYQVRTFDFDFDSLGQRLEEKVAKEVPGYQKYKSVDDACGVLMGLGFFGSMMAGYSLLLVLTFEVLRYFFGSGFNSQNIFIRLSVIIFIVGLCLGVLGIILMKVWTMLNPKLSKALLDTEKYDGQEEFLPHTSIELKRVTPSELKGKRIKGVSFGV